MNTRCIRTAPGALGGHRTLQDIARQALRGSARPRSAEGVRMSAWDAALENDTTARDDVIARVTRSRTTKPVPVAGSFVSRNDWFDSLQALPLAALHDAW